MKHYKFIALFLSLIIIASVIFLNFKTDKQFVIIVASYNNQEWYRYNLNSIFAQTYKNYRVIYIDDCSPDGTGKLVQDYIESRKMADKVTLIKNESRKGALANHYTAIHMCKNNEIIVCLDGDDWFAHDNVLEYLNNVYQNSSIWLTYSQFCNWPSGELGWSEEIPQNIIKENKFREFGFVSPQLRTYYAWLAKLVKKSDLQTFNGTSWDFFPIAGDVALMFPMLEKE